VIAACALKSLGGVILGKARPQGRVRAPPVRSTSAEDAHPGSRQAEGVPKSVGSPAVMMSVSPVDVVAPAPSCPAVWMVVPESLGAAGVSVWAAVLLPEAGAAAGWPPDVPPSLVGPGCEGEAGGCGGSTMIDGLWSG
jgi:hypothetical protein